MSRKRLTGRAMSDRQIIAEQGIKIAELIRERDDYHDKAIDIADQRDALRLELKLMNEIKAERDALRTRLAEVEAQSKAMPSVEHCRVVEEAIRAARVLLDRLDNPPPKSRGSGGGTDVLETDKRRLRTLLAKVEKEGGR